MIKIEKFDEVYLHVTCPTEISLEIKDFFSCYAPNFRFHPRFKARIWDGRISFYDHKTHLLPIGLLNKLIEFILDNNYKYELIFNESDFFDESIDQNKILSFSHLLFKNGNIFPRDYQIEAIVNSLYHKKGIVESPTGSGKSLIIYTIIRYLIENTNKKVLLIVPSISLVNQMFSDFKEYGWENLEEFVDILYSGKKLTDKKILISTYQSLVNKEKSFFDEYGSILMDECHGMSVDSKSLKNIMLKTDKVIYKFGFTGTLPEEDADLFTIFGYLGPQIFELKTKDLMDKGILSKIKIVNLIYKYPDPIIKEFKNRTFPEEERMVETCSKRMKILDFVLNRSNESHNTLILCRHINHLQSIATHISTHLKQKFKVSVIYGEINPDEREKLRKIMEVENNMVLVGTYATMKQGINIKRIHNIIFASSYKSKITILQSIGRMLRLSDDKECAVLWDIIDDLRWTKRTGKVENNYLYDHFEQRLKYYIEQKFDYANLQISDKDLSLE